MTLKTLQKIKQTIFLVGILVTYFLLGWAGFLHSHVSIISYISNKGW